MDLGSNGGEESSNMSMAVIYDVNLMIRFAKPISFLGIEEKTINGDEM